MATTQSELASVRVYAVGLKQNPQTIGVVGSGVAVGVGVPPIAPGGSPIAVGVGAGVVVGLAVGDGVASAAHTGAEPAATTRAAKIIPVKRLFTVCEPFRGLGWVIDTDYF